jgi:tetratricopeptide (TPR) repeat protein
LKESSLLILGPLALVFVGAGVLEGYAVDLGRRPAVIRIEPGDGTADAATRLSLGEERDVSPGVAWKAVGPLTESEAELKRRLEQDPADIDAHYAMARLLEGADRADEATWFYDRTLELNPAHQSAALHLGSLHTQRGDTAAAIAVLEGAVEVSGGKTKARVLYALGRARLHAGEPLLAVLDFERAIQYRPDHVDSWLKLGQALSTAGKPPADAERAYRMGLSLEPSSTEALTQLGRVLATQGHTAEAVLSYRSAVAADPQAKDARYRLAQLLEDNGDPAGARIQYEWLARNETGTTRALLTQGNIALQDGDVELAIDAYRRAVEVEEGRRTEPWLRLGRTLARSGRHDEALEAYHAFSQQFPGDPRGALGTGRVLLTLGRLDEALGHVDQALRGDPDSVESWFLRGRLLGRLHRTAEAHTAYGKVLELRPSYRKALLNLAVLERQSGHAARAIELYRKILDEHPSYTPALFNLALTLTKTGRETEAAQTYSRVLETDPEHQAARLNLAVLARKRGDERRAEQLLHEALLQDPADVPARYNLALLLDATGRPTDAVRELRRITLLDTGFAKAWKSLGRLHEETGERAAAWNAYERALQLDPSSRMARQGLRRCRDAKKE